MQIKAPGSSLRLKPSPTAASGSNQPALTFGTHSKTGFGQNPASFDGDDVTLYFSGRRAFDFFAEPADTPGTPPTNTGIRGLGSNRFTIRAAASLIFETVANHIEFEGGTADIGIGVVGYQIGTANGQTIYFSTDPSTPAVIPLATRLVASQTADSQQWQDASGVKLSGIDKDGNFTMGATTSLVKLGKQVGPGNKPGVQFGDGRIFQAATGGLQITPGSADTINGALRLNPFAGVDYAGLVLWNNEVNANSRNWQIVNNYQANGNLDIMRSSSAGGQPSTVVAAISRDGHWTLSNNLRVNGDVGFYNTAPIAKQTGVAVTAGGIHAALVALGLIAA